VKDVQVEELWSLDEESFANLKPVYGLIFLFKWQPEQDERPVAHDVDGLFFARQVITNACATQAILSILLNSPTLELGDTLDNFKGFACALDPESAGEAINSLDDVRRAHNSFNRPEPFIPEEKQVATKDDDVFHFIAYIPFRGKIYELDGLKPGPICLAEQAGKDWLATVRPHIEQRMQKYAGSEIRFNLLAVTRDRRASLQEHVEGRATRASILEDALSSAENVEAAPGFVPVELEDDEGFLALLEKGDQAELAAQLRHENRQKDTEVSQLEAVEQRFAAWKAENIRRKHNYIPLCVAMLHLLAEKNKLGPMVEAAKKQQQDRRAAAAKGEASS